MNTRKSIEIEGLRHENPIPAACVIGNIVMTSLIFGMELHTRKFPDDIQGQCRLMFENVHRAVQAAGGTPENIIKMVVWIKDNSLKTALNKEWLTMFPDEHSRPARQTMLYGGFNGNALIQCEVVAVLDEAPVTLRD
jgi:2-iminobutanoate/2-iminopropanoate deaminase